MPVYEYKCNDCGEKFEVTQTQYNVVKPKCPKCKSEGSRRVFSAHARLSSSTPAEPIKPSSGFG